MLLFKHTALRIFFTLMTACGIWLATPAAASAQEVVCNSFSMSDVSFGVFSPFDAPPNTSGQVSFQCYNTNSAFLGLGPSIYAAICINFGAGSAGGTTAARNMSTTGAASSTPLQYQIYKSDGSVWGSYNFSGATASQQVLELPVKLILGDYIRKSGTMFYTASVGSGQSTAIPGAYISRFSATQASIVVVTGSNSNVTCLGQSSSSANASVSPSSLSFNATATVQKACQVQVTTASNMDFGAINPLTPGPFDTTSNINARCTTSTPYNIALEPGGTPTPTNGQGTLRNSATVTGNPDTYVSYGLFRDAGRGQPWGNIGNTNTVDGTGTGAYPGAPVNIYGRITNGNVRPGDYTDNVVVKVVY